MARGGVLHADLPDLAAVRAARPGGSGKSLADVLAEHRTWHARDALRSACAEVLASGDVDGVVARYAGPPGDQQAA